MSGFSVDPTLALTLQQQSIPQRIYLTGSIIFTFTSSPISIIHTTHRRDNTCDECLLKLLFKLSQADSDFALLPKVWR